MSKLCYSCTFVRIHIPQFGLTSVQEKYMNTTYSEFSFDQLNIADSVNKTPFCSIALKLYTYFHFFFLDEKVEAYRKYQKLIRSFFYVI